MPDVSTDFLHDIPDDLQVALDGDPSLLVRWTDLTPLARNEWICWMTSAKKQETRDARFDRLQDDIMSGKRRPCCWPGCPHRRASAQKYFRD